MWTEQIETEIVTSEAPISVEGTARESSVEVVERQDQAIKIPGSEIEFALAKSEVSELEPTPKEASVGKFHYIYTTSVMVVLRYEC